MIQNLEKFLSLNPANPSGVETKTMQQFLSKGLLGFMTNEPAVSVNTKKITDKK